VKVAAHFDKIAPRGEIVVVVGGKIITKEPKKVNFLRKNNHEKKKLF
jgi:16S rRNA (cytidine1402-2'-O)-methyltransferase